MIEQVVIVAVGVVAVVVAGYFIRKILKQVCAVIYAEGRIEGEADAGGYVTDARAREIYAQCGVKPPDLHACLRGKCGDGGEAEKVS